MIMLTVSVQYTPAFHDKMKLSPRHYIMQCYYHKLLETEVDDYINDLRRQHNNSSYVIIKEPLTDELNNEYFNEDDDEIEEFDEEENE